MTTKPYNCWSCRFFKADNPLSSRVGRCHRFAPHSLDYYGFSGIEVETPVTTKGDLYTFDTDDARLPVGSDGQVLAANSATDTGLEWQDAAAAAGVPLTTKGDILTRNDANNVALPVGSDGQVLTANSAAAAGVDWETPFSSPLTTKGDLMVNNGSIDTRLPVGTDGQILIPDAAEASGLKWIDRSVVVNFQGSYIGTNTGGAELTMGRNGATTFANPEYGIAQQLAIFDSGGELPFSVTPNSEIIAVSVNLTSGAVFDATVGANPHVRIFFYDIDGTTDTYRGVASVPIPAAKVGVSSDVSADNYHFELLKLATPIGPFSTGGFLGWRVDLTDTADNEVIYAVRNLVVNVWVRIPLSDLLDTSLLVTKAAIKETSLSISNETDAPEKISAAVPVAKSLSISPALAPTSEGKWSVIYDAALGWCGQYTKTSSTVPPMP